MNPCDSFTREESYKILIEFSVPMKKARLIKRHLNEIHSNICIGKHVSVTFPL
jgi:hypothetical protein